MATRDKNSEEQKEITLIYGGRYYQNKSTPSYVYYLETDEDRLEKLLFKSQLVKNAGIGLKISCIDKGSGTYGNFKSTGNFAEKDFINRQVARDASVAYQIAQHKAMSKTPENDLDNLRAHIKLMLKGMSYAERKHFIAGLFADLISI